MDVHKFSTYIIALGLVVLLVGTVYALVGKSKADQARMEYGSKSMSLLADGIRQTTIDATIGSHGYLDQIDSGRRQFETGKWAAIIGGVVTFLGIGMRKSARRKD